MNDETTTTTFERIGHQEAWVARNLLTRDECERLVQRAKEANIEHQPSPGTNRLRSCLRVEIDHEDLARTVWNRIKDHVPQELVINNDGEEEENPGILLPEQKIGTWRPCSVNTHWRIVCYPGQGHFGPHRDDEYKIDDNCRSFLTINGYLTDRPLGHGGATRFLKDDLPLLQDEENRFCAPAAAVLHRVEADRAGKAVVFLHGYMHDGEPLLNDSPPKWLFRTEVMYRRDPESIPVLTEAEQEARQLVQKAEAAETNGDIPAAMKLYRRAYQLDPKLDR